MFGDLFALYFFGCGTLKRLFPLPLPFLSPFSSFFSGGGTCTYRSHGAPGRLLLGPRRGGKLVRGLGFGRQRGDGLAAHDAGVGW